MSTTRAANRARFAAATKLPRDPAPNHGTQVPSRADRRTTPPASQDARKTEGQRFKAAFGDELGARLFADGLTWDEAQGHYNVHMRDQVTKLTTELTEKDKTIASLRDQLGEGSDQPRRFLGSENCEAFVRGVKLPSKN